jgi:hypothetical protein
LALRSLFVCERDYLIRDNTVLPKRFATTIEGLALFFAVRSANLLWSIPRTSGLDE